MLKTKIIIGSISVLLILCVFELIRRRRLKEKYALLWLLSGLVIFTFSIFPTLLNSIADLMGMYYLTTLFIISFLFLLAIVLHFSTVISRLSERNKYLAQELGILQMKFRELEEKTRELDEKSLRLIGKEDENTIKV